MIGEQRERRTGFVHDRQTKGVHLGERAAIHNLKRPVRAVRESPRPLVRPAERLGPASRQIVQGDQAHRSEQKQTLSDVNGPV